ncbi:hypothetical protein AA21291_0279 [Swaminathania salitolerans LMG 21291]|uniref:Uncharacterized protein n=1 Tax=Swaminathania salitolerans TaxID=182838 RepID=A0A511BT57_9PROT|nr:hypothetical protein AA21291_0279 [Swaminathania salitolerans LMG 21291]GEL01138.1 hypothetical protein SSA02_03010 [Swaminathania salitolerans]
MSLRMMSDGWRTTTGRTGRRINALHFRDPRLCPVLMLPRGSRRPGLRPFSQRQLARRQLSGGALSGEFLPQSRDLSLHLRAHFMHLAAERRYVILLPGCEGLDRHAGAAKKQKGRKAAQAHRSR